jgi:2-keto-4-pentenoate hydratase/2-oxohepta-3-ene-1,7-dioic acid hydratase in catechol pathway
MEFWAVVDGSEQLVSPIDVPFREWAPAICRDPLALTGHFGAPEPLDNVELLAPVEPGATIYAGGANYGKHLAELGLDGATPTVFLKAGSSLIGPRSQVDYPAVTDQLDYEIELVAIFGAHAFDPDQPWAGVLGYAVGNDVSARDLQFTESVTGMDMFSAKSLKATSPVGPWILTRDEVGDHQPDLAMSLAVNGVTRQQSRTSEMIWDVAALIRYVDDRSGISCGDVLFTGSPAGIGHSSGHYLQPGDIVDATIEGIGTLHNAVGTRPGARAVG